MRSNNGELEIQTWLTAINPNLVLNNGVCNFDEPSLNVQVGISIDDNTKLITFCSPNITLNADNKSFLLEKALLVNAEGNKMEGCWLSLIDNELLLTHVRDTNTLDQVNLANLINNFTLKSHELQQELTAEVDLNNQSSNHLTSGVLV
ncbi:CesT family type III secretion system chaperone [Shewanella sp. VB17]|uniref:CesT family type III secretion system chaperone n=1 Tax=Shewanella sp. VB17 TaxID=2739432 RepID=UPI0015646882|nr:CesT family type III secretion system chaperone [Shewanella sp. VB17]NRD74789.1 CesT family type III secretion system chaperone [Shewanella sp. VB17]